ncbi:MAG: recombinase family protein [Enterocloster bolteae]
MKIERYDAIYAWQSVDKKDSVSIETQIDECKSKCENKNLIRIYQDKGFSGKNTDRPDVQRLINDIEQGIIKKVVVYKLDRISRNMKKLKPIIKSMPNLKLWQKSFMIIGSYNSIFQMKKENHINLLVEKWLGMKN